MKEITSEELGLKVDQRIADAVAPFVEKQVVPAENKRPGKCCLCNNKWYRIIDDKPYCQKHTKLKLPKGKPLMLEKKRHRNEPCPCGSGKKFKTCCIHKTIV